MARKRIVLAAGSPATSHRQCGTRHSPVGIVPGIGDKDFKFPTVDELVQRSLERSGELNLNLKRDRRLDGREPATLES